MIIFDDNVEFQKGLYQLDYLYKCYFDIYFIMMVFYILMLNFYSFDILLNFLSFDIFYC